LLHKNGFQTSLLTTPGTDLVTRSLKNAIYLQVFALALAERKQMVEVAFLSDPGRLGLSNKLIY